MRDAQARTVYLKDYHPPEFLIEETQLHFDLFDDHAVVTSSLQIRANDSLTESGRSTGSTLVLHGQELVLKKLQINDKVLTESDYSVDDESLTIHSIEKYYPHPDEKRFILTCVTHIEPQSNTALEGLYQSGDMFCTQCEAEGFRRITYYLDRPDVMSVFTTTVVAEREKYPVLLSNGNCTGEGLVADNPARHWVSWQDPFKKPCYLFALVAGNLQYIEDRFVTMSGREIRLQIFVEEKDLDKCDHAMASLKHSMKWDEEVYGREYDLDIFMIVAVDTFNMGAMENKGLNIFNTSCVLANQATTTDAAFQRVEGVVAHEYFHNWSGNRVTCRDWFQLSLKEGFTVFRDSEFSADMGSRTVKRIEDVTLLRTAQFAEDAGPMSHPVRPDSYMEISNFYTLTVYEKGAEVVRMISQILGPDDFRKGTDLYFERHDGQAVTTEDFVKAMEDASGASLQQFRNWYTQAGTPVLDITMEHDPQKQLLTLNVSQHCPATPGQPDKKPFHIPCRIGLLAPDGHELNLKLIDSGEGSAGTDMVLHITEKRQSFVLTGISEKPVPSLLRGFSAPVRLNYDYTAEDIYFLMLHDSDGFNRWNASQQLALKALNEIMSQASSGQHLEMPSIIGRAFKGVLQSSLEDSALDKAMVAQLLSLPSESYLIEIADCAAIDTIHSAREFLLQSLANELEPLLLQVFRDNSNKGSSQAFSVSADAVAQRSLKNLALDFLSRIDSGRYLDLCLEQFESATNMTDRHSALRYLVNSPDLSAATKTDVLASFYKQGQKESLVVDLWFATQSSCPLPGTLDRVEHLMQHNDFSMRNPNKVRSLIGVFCGQNHVNFHARDGRGYRFLADRVIDLNRINPQIASRMLTPLTRWRKFDTERSHSMKEQLQRIHGTEGLSRDVFEVVEKSLVAN